MRIRIAVVTLVVSSLLWSPSAMAQQRPSAASTSSPQAGSGRPESTEGRHVVDPAQMRQAIADQATTDQQNRAAVLNVLQRTQVRELAARLGLNVTRAENAVSTLDSAELERLAGPALIADAQMAGGSTTIVISVTTLLLIIIIVILIAR